MKIKLIVLSLGLLSMLPAFAKTEASVNGVEITTKQIEKLQSQSLHTFGRELSRSELLDTLVRTEVVKQSAAKSGVVDSKDIAEKVAEFKERLIINAYMKKLSEEAEISDDEYKKSYDEFVKNSPKKRYKARHILLKEESEAKEVIKALGGKAENFSKLAKEKSIGPSGQNGGSLGWFEPKAMVKEFSDAVVKLKKGEIGKKPIKTRFGYHIIWLEDVKDNKVPSLDEVKSELKSQLMPAKLLEKVESLTKKAKIEKY